MKNEREIAELIFDKFRVANCKVGHIVQFRSIRFGLLNELNPKEIELFHIVFVGLQALDYFTYEETPSDLIRLSQKGYDYIYDDEKIEFVSHKPWLIPEMVNTNWDIAYNRLWRVIGPQDTASHYLSGSDFYKFVFNLCDDIPPTYSEYIAQRRENDLSTTRSTYYKELIGQLDIDTRFKLYVDIQLFIELLPLAKSIDTDEFDLSLCDVLTPPVSTIQEDQTTAPSVSPEDVPKVFISYSWDSEEHSDWVLKLAEKLAENGVNVILDKWDIGKLGQLLPHFMECSIADSERVICVMTPNYKKKTDNLEGGVGYEYSIITAQIFGKGINTPKFIPLIRSGSDADAIPTALSGRMYLDMRNDSEFSNSFNELLRDIHKAPKYKKPTIGPKPQFD